MVLLCEGRNLNSPRSIGSDIIKMLRRHTWLFFIFISFLFSCEKGPPVSRVPRASEPAGFVTALSDAALERTRHKERYDGSYQKIAFPGGDVPDNIGVCADVVVRSYRALGIDLQKEVHEEMKADFNAFPKAWGLSKPDTNIDHRRVLNLRVFFSRRGIELPVTDNAQDYQPGDIVTWSVWSRPHIGIIVDRTTSNGRRFMVVHNIGRGSELEDMLFSYRITGHYRYYGSFQNKPAAVRPEASL